MTDAERSAAICDQLRHEIERICDEPVLHGANAYTPRRTVYVSIVNGWPKAEAEVPMVLMSLLDAAASTLTHARELRDQIQGAAYLVWRKPPEMVDGMLYLRLCFEPV